MNNTPKPSPMISLAGLEGSMAKTALLLSLCREGILRYKSLSRTISALKILMRRRKNFQGDFPAQKVAKVSGRYFWSLGNPGFPSAPCKLFQSQMLQLAYPHSGRSGLQVVFFSVTKKCSLHCEHCYEWDELHKEETLSPGEIAAIVRKFQDLDVCTFFFEGGEPLMRLEELLPVFRDAAKRSDCWIITSGYRLAREKALALKEAGLTGVLVSLDHFDPALHNRFRGNDQAFHWAARAVEYANEAGLVTALSLCATRDFSQEENLASYMELARQWSVSFVQILEPRAKGRYTGRDVALSQAQQQMLEEIFIRYNSSPTYKDYPLIFYPAYHQRRIGCVGAGESYLYIDSDGFVEPCPFCGEKTAHALQFPAEDLISLVRHCGCLALADKNQAPH